MIKERQKTDALSDAAEVPDGATHYDIKTNEYVKEYYGNYSCWCVIDKCWWHQVDYETQNLMPL